MGSHENYLVRVSCMTYNQSAYITDAMNGFTMQQTDFPFVCTIVDDASTDGEQEVIKEYVQEHFDLQDSSVSYEKDTDYGHVTFTQHKTNKNCFFAVILLKENHYSQKKSKALYLTEWMDTKYVALCEGDDYWTDPLKLQRQVDFLEEHEEYSMCCHRYQLYYQDEGVWENDYVEDLFRENPDGFTFGHNETIKRLISHTATVLYRTSFMDTESIKKYNYNRDVHLVYHLLLKGPGYYFPIVGSVYRKHKNGIYTSMDARQAGSLYDEIYFELFEKNLGDINLRESYIDEVRFLLYHHDCSKRTKRILWLCAKSCCYTDGVFGVVRMIMKMMKSYFKGSIRHRPNNNHETEC